MMSFAVQADSIKKAVSSVLKEKALRVDIALDEVTVVVSAESYLDAMRALSVAELCKFDQLVDLCGVDYVDYADGRHEGARFAVIVHLLSTTLNQRIRVKVDCPEDTFPVVASVVDIWNSANWYEREAFDLFGIVFDGHNDLRRILTDYGFIGHPFRKDFPLSGDVEMRYDPVQRRVVYEPITVEPREITPRIIREDNYGGVH